MSSAGERPRASPCESLRCNELLIPLIRHKDVVLSSLFSFTPVSPKVQPGAAALFSHVRLVAPGDEDHGPVFVSARGRVNCVRPRSVRGVRHLILDSTSVSL